MVRDVSVPNSLLFVSAGVNGLLVSTGCIDDLASATISALVFFPAS